LTGVPFIPGSAVKGCARRMAVQRLRAESDPRRKIELLVQIASVFGSSVHDWQPDSDFAWACASFWPATAPVVRQRLDEMGRPGPHVVGGIRFLPAYPWFSPEKDLELDVINCHHPSYYHGKPEMAGAPDVEEPMVLYFPVIAPGHVFAFALTGPPRLRSLAAAWLREGLAVLGLGAKTTAGYGWFDTSDAVQAGWREKARQLQGAELERQRRERELIAQARQEEAASRQAAAQAEAMANLTPQQLEDLKIARLTPEQFRSKLQSFPRHVGDKQHLPEQLAIVRALQKDRLAAWDDLKQRAQRGGPWAQAEQAIRLTAKKANLGKMP
jgi:CRISPR type III-B/RAMP module RAMP protein Cmr6